MKTLEEIKDEVAKEKFDCRWGEIRNLLHMDLAIDAVAKRCAEQAIERAVDLCGITTFEGKNKVILDVKNELK